jgi:hypothetical protein
MNPELANKPKLRLKLFHYAGLEGAGNEAKFFMDYREFIRIDGGCAWPHDGVRRPWMKQFAQHLRDPSRSFSGIRQRVPDQIVHFACHCNTSDDGWEDHCLELSCGGKGGAVKISIKELQAQFTDIDYRRMPRYTGDMPLVFLNACEGSKLGPNGSHSFPQLFLNKNGNRGFIGAESKIPDDVAAAFSKQFYFHLLAGKSVVDALWQAKHDLWERWYNPLGLVYTLYAYPHLRVSHPVPISELKRKARL